MAQIVSYPKSTNISETKESKSMGLGVACLFNLFMWLAVVLFKNIWSGCLHNHSLSQFSSVQSLSCVLLFATPWIAAHQAFLYITNSRSSHRLTSIKSVMPSSHLILCRSLLLLPPIPPSIRVFPNESTLRMRWPKYWSFSFSIILSKEILGLISFRMDWLDLLAVQGTLKSLLQHTSVIFPFHLWRMGIPERHCLDYSVKHWESL